MAVAANSNDVVRVSVADLVRLARPASAIKLGRAQSRATLIGDYLSPFKGRGMEFDESRPYQAGDDVRNLNWRVMARTGKPFTKLFREERERPVFLMVDLRQRMFFATQGVYKAVLAARAAALVAWAASQNGDRVGGVVFSDYAHHELKPTRGKRGVLRLINQLVAHSAGVESGALGSTKAAGLKSSIVGGQNAAGTTSSNGGGASAAGSQSPKLNGSADAAHQALLRLRHLVRPGSLVFLLSDFYGLGDKSQPHIAQLARHNELAFFFVHDPFEAQLPPPGSYRLSDGAADWVLDTTDDAYREQYRQRFEQHEAQLRTLAHQNRIRLVSCRTNQDPLAILKTGLNLRS